MAPRKSLDYAVLAAAYDSTAGSKGVKERLMFDTHDGSEPDELQSTRFAIYSAWSSISVLRMAQWRTKDAAKVNKAWSVRHSTKKIEDFMLSCARN